MKILKEVNNLITEIKLGPKSLIAGGLLTAGTIGGVGGLPGVPSPAQIIRAKNNAKMAYTAYVYGKPLASTVGSMITRPSATPST